MSLQGKHIMPHGNRRGNSLFRSILFLCLVVLCFRPDTMNAQVISNSGAFITISNGAAVTSKDFENNNGNLDNNGTIELSRDFLNQALAETKGNGLYSLKGNWTDYGTFSGTSEVSFDGNNTQHISRPSGETFYKLTINNSADSVSQLSNPLSTLKVTNLLNIKTGTLALHYTTKNLVVNGSTIINGGLSYDKITVQTTSIDGNLSGTGRIDMSGGGKPHLLNLKGSTNEIGTFITNSLSYSVVDYIGTNQTVFATPNYRNLYISNSGVKTLQGNSTIGNIISIKAGTTFDLGTITTSVNILDSALVAGSLKFSGTSTKTASIEGDLSGAGSIDMSGPGLLWHLLNLGGANNSIGSYTAAGSESTVDYNGDDNQSVFISQNYQNLRISGDSVKTLTGTIATSTSGVLSMLAGSINANGHLLKVTNPDTLAILRQNGTIIGKLQRVIGELNGDYLYPVGSDSSYNPMLIKFRELSPGSLTAQYIPNSIGDSGLPVEDVDDGDELFRSLPEGYWNLTADAALASNNFDVKLNYNGFDEIDPSCRILRRNGLGSLMLDGKDASINGSLIQRETLISPISNVSTDFAIGKGRPHIQDQPSDSAICEFLNAQFKVVSNRLGSLTYQWQANTGTGFYDILPNDTLYSNTTSSGLEINAAPYSMNGTRYRVIVRDEWNNPNISIDTLFTVFTNPEVKLDSSDLGSCNGAKDGAIYIDILKGTPIYKFQWKTDMGVQVSTDKDLINQSYGKYLLSVWDVNHCATLNNKLTLGALKDLLISYDLSLYGIMMEYNISCYGKEDGEIIVNSDGNGDPAAFSYEWRNIDTGPLSNDTKTLSGIGAGNYYVTVTDELSCQGSASITLFPPDPISVTRVKTNYPGNFDISCFGMGDGVINLDISGGHTADNALPLDKYNWSKNEDTLFSKSTKNIVNLLEGEYNLAIQDSFSCFADTLFTFELKSPENFKITADIANFNGYQVSCKSSTNSVLDLNVSGSYPGNIDYKYLWTTADGVVSNPNTLDQAGLPEGNYKLHVVDSINCFADSVFVITAPDSISVSPVKSNFNNYEISCFGGDNGSIMLNPSGGITAFPYQYAWNIIDGSGIVEGAANQNNLTKGEYSVTVKDANDCEVMWNYVFDEPKKLITHIDSFSIACFNVNTGAADLTVSEGVSPYTYIWSNGETTEDIGSLSKGIYFVDIIDDNNCHISDTTEVTQPPDIIISLDAPLQYSGRMISCFGESNGIVNSLVTGGFGAYTYKWKRGTDMIQSGLSKPSISDIPAGLYTLSITDENLCSDSANFLVEQPLELNAEVFATDPSCFGKTDGQITLMVRGGTPAYSFNWIGTSQTTQTAENLGVGSYEVIITDLNMCTDNAYGILDQPQLISIYKPEEDIIQPDCPDIFNGAIRYEINGGTQPYEMVLYNLRNISDSLVLGDGTTKVVSDLEQGKYRLKITDNKLCELSDTSILKALKALCIGVPNAFTPNGDGVNDTWEIELIDIYPNATVEIYNRWGEMIYYASKGYSKPWDGTFKGRELPIDSYFYIIDLKNGRDPVSGDITIIK